MKATQEERLDYLVEQFKEDSVSYSDIETPSDAAGKKRLLRSLMNIRMPGELPSSVLRVQDEYLSERNRIAGIVKPEDIPVAAEQGSALPFAEKISLWQGDITRLAADAIVNAANSQMLGCFIPMHGCIDNCIHTYAGVQLRGECARQMDSMREIYGSSYEQPVALPMLTDAYNLPAKKIIHIVGPAVSGRLTAEHEKKLAECYVNTLKTCEENGLGSVAFCCISTGVFSFPPQRAAEIAVKTVTAWMKEHPEAMDRVIFNVFGDSDRLIYEKLIF